MRESLRNGLLYGIAVALVAYSIVQFIGYNPQSLMVLLYLYVLQSVILKVKTDLAQPLLPLLKRIVIVAEGEEMKLKRLLTGEEYRVNGDVEKL
jgi:hypothetical protein